MFNNKVSGHGTIKKLRNGMVISTIALSMFGVSTQVSASEVTPKAEPETEVAPKETTTTETPKTVQKPAETKAEEVKPEAPKHVSQQDVDTAKSESDQAKQNVTKQQEVISEKQTQLQNAEKTVTEIKEQVKEVNSVTPEKVADAKADADAKAKAVTSAVESVQSAEKSVTATSEKVANQTKVVSNAEKTATATAEKVANAQKKVDSLSSNTDITKLEGDVYGLSNQVTVDTKAVTTAQGKLAEGKKAIADKEQAMKDAQKKVDSLEATLKEKATVLNNANSNLSQKEEALNSAKADLNSAKEELKDVTEGIYNINLGSEYVSLLKEYFANPSKALSDKLKALAFKEYEKFGKITFDKNGEVYRYDLVYPKESKKDLATKVNINNLDYNTRKELSLFAADLINQVRKQFGTEDVKVTEDSVRIANEVARKSTEEYGHDFKALNEVGKENGVLLGELAGFSDDPATTLADIKKRIYDDVLSMLFDDAHAQWGHATSLSGVLPENKNEGYMQYTGLGFRSNATFTSVIHYIKISDNMVSAKSKFDKTKVISAPSTTEKVARLQENVKLANTAYLNAYKELEDAKNDVYLAKTGYGKVDYELFTARNLLSDIRMNKVDIPALEKALDEAKSKLAEDTQALQTAKEVLAIAKSNAIDKAKALVEAKKSLSNAKAEQKTADEALATAKGELEVLTKAKTVAEMALTKANKELDFARNESKEATKKFNFLNSALTEKPTALKDLDTKLANVEAKIATIRAELETAKEELTRLEGISKAKEEDYLKVKSLKDAQDKAEAEAKRLKELEEAEAKRLKELKEKEDSIRNNGGQPVEVHDATGKVVDVVDAKAQNKVVDVAYNTATPKATTQETAKAETKQATQKVLPNTGEASSMLPLVGTLLGMGVIGAYRKRKDEE